MNDRFIKTTTYEGGRYMKKKVISIALCIVIMLAHFRTAFAYPETSVATVNEKKVDFLTHCFADPNTVIVLDKNSHDISRKFIQDNYEHFLVRDYESIMNYLNVNVSEISYEREEIAILDENMSPFALSRSKTVSRVYWHYLQPTGIITGFYLDFTIRGTFHYEPNSGKITSTGNTSITDIGYTDKPMGFIARIEYITYDAPRIIDNGYTALFGATIKVCGYSESSPVIIAEDFAPVHATVSGQAD